MKGTLPVLWSPRLATLLTGWRRREAAGSTAPSGSASVTSCDCSPAAECGKSTAPGRALPGRPAAGEERPGRGKGAGKAVCSDTPAAAPPGRLGVPAPFYPRPGPGREEPPARESSSANSPDCCATTRSLGCCLLLLKAGKGRTQLRSVGGCRGQRTKALTDNAPPLRPARNVCTHRNQPIGATNRGRVGDGTS